MNDLDKIRQSINEIDLEIIKQFEKRMSMSKLVAEYKIENNKPIYDKKREEALIKKNITLLNNKDLEEYYFEVLQAFLKVSKDYQQRIVKGE